MKLVIAFVQPFMASKVVHALHQVAGLSGVTLSQVWTLGADERKPGRRTIPVVFRGLRGDI